MQKIKCPKCKNTVFETDGKSIYIRIPRERHIKDGVNMPFSAGPYFHALCETVFYIHNLTTTLNFVKLEIDITNNGSHLPQKAIQQ